jgi:hypothetical protein
MRALLCYGATERNGGAEEARRGLDECRRFLRDNRRPLVRGCVGLHASFTVSDETARAAGELAREPRRHRGARILLVLGPRVVQLREHGRDPGDDVGVIPGPDHAGLTADLEIAIGQNDDPHGARGGMQLERHALRRGVDHRVTQHAAGDPRQPITHLLGIGSAPEERAQASLGLPRPCSPS